MRGSLKESVTHKYGVPDQQSITRQWDNIQQSVSRFNPVVLKRVLASQSVLCYCLNVWVFSSYCLLCLYYRYNVLKLTSHQMVRLT